MGQGMRKSVGPVSRADVTVIFINQVRMKIGVVFGNPETTPGGAALKFYASIRLDIRQVGDPILDDAGEPIGKYSRVKVVKNKVAPPMKQCQIPIIWGRGIAEEYELFDELVTQGILTKTSSYFTYRDQKVNGRVNALAMVRERAAEMRADLDRKLASPDAAPVKLIPKQKASAAEIALREDLIGP
jgi:recombination protein RecA